MGFENVGSERPKSRRKWRNISEAEGELQWKMQSRKEETRKKQRHRNLCLLREVKERKGRKVVLVFHLSVFVRLGM